MECGAGTFHFSGLFCRAWAVQNIDFRGSNPVLWFLLSRVVLWNKTLLSIQPAGCFMDSWQFVVSSIRQIRGNVREGCRTVKLHEKFETLDEPEYQRLTAFLLQLCIDFGKVRVGLLFSWNNVGSKFYPVSVHLLLVADINYWYTVIWSVNWKQTDEINANLHINACFWLRDIRYQCVVFKLLSPYQFFLNLNAVSSLFAIALKALFILKWSYFLKKMFIFN